jgi:hypothetical protein
MTSARKHDLPSSQASLQQIRAACQTTPHQLDAWATALHHSTGWPTQCEGRTEPSTLSPGCSGPALKPSSIHNRMWHADAACIIFSNSSNCPSRKHPSASHHQGGVYLTTLHPVIHRACARPSQTLLQPITRENPLKLEPNSIYSICSCSPEKHPSALHQPGVGITAGGRCFQHQVIPY